ncbi:acyltransferase family protein [Rhizobium sp. PAMB 3174]
MLSKTKYNPDIDGLRAVAVLLVLLFHLGNKIFRGGFIGVDVFFVISGYLITQQLLGEMERGEFSFRRFFARRIRRLLPALAFVITVSAVAGIFFFLPSNIEPTLWSALLSLFGLSNFLFWMQSGYFDSDAIFKPLLHTWSLGVEMQFYLFWPLLMLLAVRIRRAGARYLAMGLFLILAISLSQVWLAVDPAGAFFLTPARIFEFGVGAALNWVGNAGTLSKRVSLGALVAGLAGILICAILYRETMPFPGYYALFPCAAAAAVIMSAGSAASSVVLGNRVMALIGRASYSIYLVHWPLIVFENYLDAGLGTNWLFVISLALGFASYRWIETPFRSASFGSLKGKAFGVGMAISTFGLVFCLLVGDAVWRWRYPSDLALAMDPRIAVQGGSHTWSLLKQRQTAFADDARVKVLIIGDSQAGDMINMLDRRYGEAIDLRSFPSAAACQILVSNSFYDHEPDERERCNKRNQRILADSRIKEADIIVLVFAWRDWSPPFIKDNVHALREAGAERIILVGPKSQPGSGMDLVASLGKFEGIEAFAAATLDPKVVRTNVDLKHVSATVGVEYADILAKVCPRADLCYVLDENSIPVFFDNMHLTAEGDAFLIDKGILDDIDLGGATAEQ